MRDLPVEIYTNIFLYLKRRDLQTCYFVCKSWYTMTIQLGWETVTLQDHNISRLKLLLNAFVRKQYFKYSRLITKLAIQDAMYRDWYKFSELELLELLKQLPYLKEIDFTRTHYPNEYVGYLINADMQHINRIDTGTNLTDIRSDLLFSVYYKFRSSITCIRLLYNRNTVSFNILNFLTKFKKLTKLELRNKHDVNLTPFQIQDSCPNLEYLNFRCDPYSTSDRVMRQTLDDNRRINLNFISSLTYLELCLPYLSATYARYLIDYFPNHLTDLSIIISHQYFFNWIDIVGMDLALRLMEKSGSIKKIYIGFRGRVRDNDENNMTKYFKLLNSFRGTRQTHCTAHFNEAIPEKRRLCYSFRYDSLGRLLATLQRPNTADIAVPDKASSIIGPEIFHALEFNLLGPYDDDDDVYQVLNYSLSNFPRLQSINIVFNDNMCSKYSFSLRHKEGLISSDQANGDINLLQMEYIRPAKNIFDLVTTHLHNIEIVSLKAGKWDRKYGNPVIDLTGFKKLKSFKYTSMDENFTKENRFVLIKYTNGTERRIHEFYAKTKGRDNLSFTILCDISVFLDFRKEKILFWGALKQA
ncbi:hypothetical protein EDC94DRAFT_646931 [Helicostylum pulchrum]|nr:hypothetical protein EDC94DRAFT_646931 [Helicostylum pulchrum]